MASPFAELYESLLQREVEALEDVLDRVAGKAGEDVLERELLRFALLAFVPSEHSTHALIVSADAIHASDETKRLARADCARYLSVVRPPWSEAPLLERIPVADEPSIEHLVRLAGATRAEIEPLLDALFDRDTLIEAAMQLRDRAKHLLPVVAAVTTMIEAHPQLRRAAIRALALQWSVIRQERGDAGRDSTFAEEVARYISSGATPEAAHAVLEKDAMLDPAPNVRFDWVACDLSRDLGASISIRRIAAARRGLLGDTQCDAMIAAADRNHQHGESLSDFHFA